MIKAEEIQKYDSLVKKKFASCLMKRIAPNKIIWTADGKRVATIEDTGNNSEFKFEYDGGFLI